MLSEWVHNVSVILRYAALTAALLGVIFGSIGSLLVLTTEFPKHCLDGICGLATCLALAGLVPIIGDWATGCH